MNKTTISLKELISNVESHLSALGYSPATINRYRSCWKKIFKRCSVEGMEEFSYEKCMLFIKEEYNIPLLDNLKSHHVFYLRTIKVLNEYVLYGKILKCHQNFGVQVTPEFEDILSDFIMFGFESGLSERTMERKSIQLTRFLNYIKESDISEIGLLEIEPILLYVKHISEKGYSMSTRSGILFTLRSFLSFLYERKYITIPMQQLFPVIFSNKMERIPSYYDEDELKNLISHVNRDEDIGKRDYLILLLAVQLGIRAGDIRMIKLESIKWGKGTIEFIQQKTGNPIQLPLLDNIKYAIIDYIRNGRPKGESPFIFLRHRAPFEAYESSNVFHYVITKYMNKAMISYSGRKHGLHSMRHSLASNLLKNNTPYPVITGILGHESTSTTQLYLSIDIEQLRSVALEVPYEE